MEKHLAEYSDDLMDIDGSNTDVLTLERTVSMRAITHLLGSVGNREVLDLACDDGSLSRWLASHGSKVTAIDNSIGPIETARIYEEQNPLGISYLVGDPEDLYMMDDSAFDDIVCNLSMGRIENLAAVIAEIARIIKLGGRFIFSVPHPCFDLRAFGEERKAPGTDNYFAEGVRTGVYGSARHRTLASYINAVAARGFTVRRVLEPGAEDRDIIDNPGIEVWRKSPVVLVVEAVFPRI